MIGKTLARYKIIEKIGPPRDGRGVTCERLEARPRRRKILPEAFARDAERMARFRREARSLAALNHPNVIRPYSVEEIDGARLLTMERTKSPPNREVNVDVSKTPGHE